ncbi:SCO family protein [Ectothiorhodospiraceae bacterium WFHF3C12]|nr:SCO family protein [Ectothiorhodospiraceae bacterium WFHF3C12]
MTAALAACGTEGGDWATTHVAGTFPPLELTLTGESGQPLTAADLRGQVVLLYFGYTYCPDVCPVTLGKLKAALTQLDEARRSEVTVLFVSVDPQRDAPRRLRTYTSGFGQRFVGATSEDLDRLRELTSRYASSFSHGEPNTDGDYLVTHSSSVYVFDEEGRARLLVRPDDTPQAIARDLRRLL